MQFMQTAYFFFMKLISQVQIIYNNLLNENNFTTTSSIQFLSFFQESNMLCLLHSPTHELSCYEESSKVNRQIEIDGNRCNEFYLFSASYFPHSNVTHSVIKQQRRYFSLLRLHYAFYPNVWKQRSGTNVSCDSNIGRQAGKYVIS